MLILYFQFYEEFQSLILHLNLQLLMNQFYLNSVILQNLVKTTKTQVAEIYLSDIGTKLILNKYENKFWYEYEFNIDLTPLSIGINQLVKTDTKISSYIGINLDAFFFSMKVAGSGTTSAMASNANYLIFKFLDTSKNAGGPAALYGYSIKLFK